MPHAVPFDQKHWKASGLVLALTSPSGTYDSLFLANYATLRLRDELTRRPELLLFGEELHAASQLVRCL